MLRISTQSGLDISVEVLEAGHPFLLLRCSCLEAVVLHWGLRRHLGSPWELPPRGLWPPGSQASGGALQTPFEGELRLALPPSGNFRVLEFALLFPDRVHWDNNQGRNYRIRLPRGGATQPHQRLEQVLRGRELVEERLYSLDEEAELAVGVVRSEGLREVLMVTDLPSTLLHWGVAERSAWEWMPAPAAWLPEGSSIEGDASRTPFVERDGLDELWLAIPEAELPIGLPFVLHQPDNDRWVKDNDRDFFLPLATPSETTSRLAGLHQEILQKELGSRSWTLMHRFNLCYDLLEMVTPGDLEGLATLFAWLRFSAIRQLDWQRNFNTKPRELSYAQHRLTQKLAARHAARPEERELLRLILTTVGRGGEGQRVRDEILNIMHRHHLKEMSGNFLEEWHQKLHNNATPDDIVICQAYLDFLRSDGDRQVFRRSLETGGVTPARLRSYERPIRTEPDLPGHLRDALIRDFSEFLGVLKNVHSATDLSSVIWTASEQLDPVLRVTVESIWRHHADPPEKLLAQAGRVSEARRTLANRFEQVATRDLLYLDLALEDHLRQLIEASPAGTAPLALLALAAENLSLSHPGSGELQHCQRHLRRLVELPRSSREWWLETHAALERLARSLAELIDRQHGLLQPAASSLGSALRVADWAVEMFSEEVLRGRLEFAVSLLLRRLLVAIRRQAQVGRWLVISRGRVTGRVVTVRSLSSLDCASSTEPLIAIADEVGGDELIPAGVVGLLTPSTVDVVSHVAVRARNAGLLLAICLDPETLERLRSKRGQWLSLSVDASGEVSEEQVPAPREAAPVAEAPRRAALRLKARPVLTPRAWVLGEAELADGEAGAKSRTLHRLRGLLPTVRIPASIVIPFGALERTLALGPRRTAERLRRLLDELAPSGAELEARLEELRGLVLGLEPPPGLLAELQLALARAGLPTLDDISRAWVCIKQVWASQWRPLAARSRLEARIAEEEVQMAVLIQQVVPAAYSFVIHTRNPISGDPDELYAEVVPGLGETLVGNHPGRALAFTQRQGGGGPALRSFPSKSAALRGGGLIFRSDSNSEDLVGFAGAGLYSSVLYSPPVPHLIDYTTERLVVDADFRSQLLRDIAELGWQVMTALGEAQDIEGTWTDQGLHLVQARPQVGH